ncbi:hypothetical protein [Clostridium sp.]|uniref:hypothetical protein n=1 Tax=Clostridium sp. TaxID=1506 RepID=UPI001B5414BA|nr:hypothetical protein [Clostridium sp.]MBP3917315.1 hypothetical protein [Clostridium sp.]
MKYENINIDELLEEQEIKEGKKKVINLDDKKKKTYDIEDTVIREITLTGDIRVKLISNINGYFVDVRKYYKGYPTKRGIRMLASKFNAAADYLKADLKKLIG